MKFETKILETKEALTQYQDAYRRISGLTVPMEYLAFARVMGIFCNGRLEAGYVINFSGPYRYELYLTEEERANVGIFNEEARKKLIEITCVWADKKTFCTKFLRMRVLFNILGTLFTFRDRDMIVSTFIPGLEKMFIKYFPEVVYAGSTSYFGQPKYHRILKGSLMTVLMAAPREIGRRIGLALMPKQAQLPAPAAARA